MKKTINIGEKEVTFRASALTAFLYKRLFNEDLMKVITTIGDTNDVDKIFGLAYVMKFQAESANPADDMKNGKLTLEGYYEWLDEFEQTDLLNEEFFAGVVSVWIGNQQTTTNAKNHKRPL